MTDYDLLLRKWEKSCHDLKRDPEAFTLWVVLELCVREAIKKVEEMPYE
jgi:hypothetical protein